MKKTSPWIKKLPTPSRFGAMRPIQHLHGSAAFASEEEIESSGLLGGEGAYVGAVEKRGKILYLRHNGPEHILAFAPTRSGKGVGLVLPTLLSWMGSVIVLDIKEEAWNLTAGWRKQYANNIVMLFNPGSPNRSVRYNPLNEVRVGTLHEVADSQNLCMMIVDPDGKGLNDHWSKTAHALLVGVVLHSMYKERAEGLEASLLTVANTLSDPSRPFEAVLKEMLSFPHTGAGVHPVVSAAAQDMLNKADNERSGVLSTANSFLTLYKDPIVAKNTATSDFRISDLMNNQKPVSLYLGISPADLDRLRPLLRLMLNQFMRALTEKMEFKNGTSVRGYKHRLLLLLDEFPALGRLEIFQQSLAFMAGYGIKAYLIIQDLAQLYAAYTKDESIQSNCHIQIAYAPNKIDTAEALSKKCGTTTILKKNVSVSKKPGLFSSPQYSESWQEVQRPLLTPDECARLPGPEKDANGMITKAGDMLIFVAGAPPIYGKQILYFTDKTFLKRAQVEAPHETDRSINSDAELNRISEIFDDSPSDLDSLSRYDHEDWRLLSQYKSFLAARSLENHAA